MVASSVTYKNNYLNSVAIDIRYTNFLLIRDKIPLFQQEIRSDYPELEIGSPLPFDRFGNIENFNEYIFLSSDRGRTIKISINRLVIVFSKYKNWNEFSEEIKRILRIFSDITGLDTFARLGLRFRNEYIVESKNDKFDEYFVLPIKDELYKEPTYLKLNFELRKRMGDDIMTTYNIYDFNNNYGKYTYTIDMDAYNEELNKSLDQSINILSRLHNGILEEFHSQITEEFISEKLIPLEDN